MAALEALPGGTKVTPTGSNDPYANQLEQLLTFTAGYTKRMTLTRTYTFEASLQQYVLEGRKHPTRQR